MDTKEPFYGYDENKERDSVIKTGYKQTEVGVIPEDWEASPLALLTTLMTNGFVGPAKIHYTKSDESTLYIQGYNVKNNDFNFNGIKRVTLEFHKRNSKSCLREGDLLTVQTGDVGLTSIVPKELEGSNCHALIITRFKKGRLSPKFFSYYLNSNQGRERLKEIEVGTTMKHINVSDMLNFIVPIPPTQAEQTAIAKALSDTDALIQSLSQLIAKKRQIKQGAMQQLLNPYDKDGELKVGWRLRKLGDIASFYKGNGLPKSALVLNGKNKCIHYGELFTKYSEDISSVISKTDSLEFNTVSQENDVLMPTSDVTPNGLATASCIKESGVILGGDILIIRSHPKLLDGIFFSYLINIERDQIMQLVTGSTVYHLYGRDMAKFEFGIPENINEQTQIAKILTDMDTEIIALEIKLSKYQKIKQGMMQNLLTGRIRLVSE